MSRIGKKPIEIIKGVKVNKEGNLITVSGPKGKLEMSYKGDIEIDVTEKEINVRRLNDLKRNRALHGLYRALLQNLVTGVTEGYSKKLELVGIGYKAESRDNFLILQLGYSHPIVFVVPPELKVEVPAPNQIVISGIDKGLVGLAAAKIRSFREPEPYKGKGIKYEGEKIRRKAGKTAAK